jgi:Domain of unknown function (DUF4388)
VDAEEGMAKARDTATDRLSNVIEVVELGRRTGLLSAERGAGSHLEEGEVYFVAGRAIYAATSTLLGREALASLGQWGPCHFAFDTDIPPPAPNLVPAASSVGAGPNRGPLSPQLGPSRAPAGGFGSGFGWSTPPSHPAYTPPSHPAYPPPAAPPEAARGSATGNWGMSRPGGGPEAGPLGRRPRRSPDVRDLMAVVTTYHLSRSHRSILLLADGTHNVLDLARLVSKSVDEVTQLLAELEARGLIYYYE